MPKRKDLKKILVIGSGPIVIGQACEFDYSGTQAIKALKEEGIEVVLVNSNPATVMTDPDLADRTYIEPITSEFVSKIIKRERPDAILPTIGGQTALNVALELDESGILKEFGVELIGANPATIRKAEDRDAFKQIMLEVGLEVAKSFIVRTEAEAYDAVRELGIPVVIRPSRTLGGAGSGIVHTMDDFITKVRWGFECSPNSEILIEESLVGWKELEFEVMRDSKDNSVIVCSIENLDPMGVHTGDSITVAPIQTLTDKEYQILRDASLKVLRAVGVETGGSNVQFAICPKTGRQIVIEMNPRVSRSSALASKATGFPIAKIAAKLAIGYTLDEILNDITEKTPVCFEPSIDYVVVKIPRFAFEKFEGSDKILGTQMKSVGEVMAIGGSFPEALQKAIRSLEVGRAGIFGGKESEIDDLELLKAEIEIATAERLFQVARCIELGGEIEELAVLSGINPFYLKHIQNLHFREKEILTKKSLKTPELICQLKALGFSDKRIAKLFGEKEQEIRTYRHANNIRPQYKLIDTCAGEFESFTPYLYSTYDGVSHDQENNSQNEVPALQGEKIVILGSGPNRIGQGLEFDYCCVHASYALKEKGYKSIIINCNPETVSTDYDTSDGLYFEPVTVEDVSEVLEREKPKGVIVQYGGQTPLKISTELLAMGYPIIGTSPESINLAEDRESFSKLVDKLKLLQPKNSSARSVEEAIIQSTKVGFPIVVRPSFVLGGRAMSVVFNIAELKDYIERNIDLDFNHPVLIDHYLDNAIEVDVDGVSDGTEVIICGVIEHVERAGIHSGDSTFFLPTKTLSEKAVEEIQAVTKVLSKALNVVGLLNIQFAITPDDKLYVLEVNPRASRSVPFVSKVFGIPWAKVGARLMAGEKLKDLEKSYPKISIYRDYVKAVRGIDYFCVKEPVFPFIKFRGVDAKLGPEMKSTGEAMGIDHSGVGAFIRSQIAAGVDLPLSGKVFLSVKDSDKPGCLAIASKLKELGFIIIATRGTASYLSEMGIEVKPVNKVSDGSPHIVDLIREGKINLVINTPEGMGPLLDSRFIRSTSVECGVPLITTISKAETFVQAIRLLKTGVKMGVMTIQELHS